MFGYFRKSCPNNARKVLWIVFSPCLANARILVNTMRSLLGHIRIGCFQSKVNHSRFILVSTTFLKLRFSSKNAYFNGSGSNIKGFLEPSAITVLPLLCSPGSGSAHRRDSLRDRKHFLRTCTNQTHQVVVEKVHDCVSLQAFSQRVRNSSVIRSQTSSVRRLSVPMSVPFGYRKVTASSTA